DALTGRERWKLSIGRWVESPAVLSGVVYFSSRFVLMPGGSSGGELHAYDPSTKQENWKSQVGSGTVSGPVAARGFVYFGTAVDAESTSSGYLHAFNAGTGQEKWRFEGAGPAPAVSDGVAYYGSRDGLLYALNAETGQEKWRLKAAGGFLSSPVVGSGLVYFTIYGKHLHAVDLKTGQERWEFKTANAMPYSPAVADGVVYFGSTDNYFYALDARSESYFYALDARTGREKWKFKMGGHAVSAPVAAAGVVYVGSSDGYLYAIEGPRQR